MLNHVYTTSTYIHKCTDICIHIYVHKYINTQAFFSLFVFQKWNITHVMSDICVLGYSTKHWFKCCCVFCRWDYNPWPVSDCFAGRSYLTSWKPGRAELEPPALTLPAALLGIPVDFGLDQLVPIGVKANPTLNPWIYVPTGSVSLHESWLIQHTLLALHSDSTIFLGNRSKPTDRAIVHSI